jgi:acrosin
LVIDHLEPRRLLATLNGTALADIITVDISGANIVITLNGVPNNFNDAANADIIVNGNGGADIITVIRNGANPTTINGGDGDDTINVGGGVYEGLILSAVSVRGDANTDTVILNDSSALTGDTYTVNGSILSRLGAVSTTVSTVESVELQASGANDLVNVISTNTGVSYDLITNNGNDQIVIASSVGFRDLGLFINGNIALNGGGGNDTVVYNDLDNTSADTYTLDAPTFTTSAMSGVVIDFGSAVEEHVINPNAGAFAQTFNLVSALFDDVSLNAGDGDDTINLADGDFDNVFEDVSINGGGGADRIFVNSNTESSTVGWELTSTELRQLNPSVDRVIPTAVEQLILRAGTGSELLTVTGMPAGMAVTLNAGGGDDTLDASASDDIDNAITNFLFFVGGSGDDLIDATDTNDGVDLVAENYTVGTGTLQKSSASFGSLTHSEVERVLLIADGDNSQIEYASSLSTQRFTLNGGAGNDTIVGNQSLIELGGLIAGDATLNGGAGVDSLILDDSGEDDLSAITLYRLAGSVIDLVSGAGTASINYSSIDRVEITGNGNGTTFEIPSGASVLPISINGGGGNDTITVGNGNLDNNNLGVNLITVAGGTGTDSVIFNDVVDAATVGESEEYDITYSLIGSGSLAKGLLVSVLMNGMERMRVDGSTAPSFYDIGQLNIAATLVGGAANDTFDISDGNYDGFHIVGAGSININGGAGTDTVSIDDSSEVTNVGYLLTQTAFGVNSIATLSYSNAETFIVEAGSGSNEIIVAGTASGTSYSIRANAGDDTINVGTASNVVDNIQGFADLLGGPGDDTLSYNDQANSVAHAYTLGLARQIQRSGAATVQFSNLVERVILNAGTQSDVININFVNDTILNGVSVLAGAGNDTVSVGGGDFDSNILSPVTVNDGSGDDSLILRDEADDDVSDAYTLTTSQLTKTSTAVVLNFQSSVEAVRLDLPDGNELVSIFTSVDSVTVNGGAGDDTVRPLSDDIDNFGNTFFDGQGGVDRLELTNTAQVAGTGDIVRFEQVNAVVGRAVNLSIPGAEIIDYTNVETVQLDDGPHDLRIAVVGTISGTSIVVNAGDGADTMDVGDGPNVVDGIDGTVSFRGQAGIDQLLFDDANTAAARTWSIESAGVSATHMSVVIYTTIEVLLVNGGSGNDQFNIDGTLAGVSYAVNGNGGADRYDVGDTTNDIDANIIGSILMDGGPDIDQLFYNDFGDAADPDTYTFGAGASESLIKTGSGNMNALFIESRMLIANNGNNTIIVNNALPGLSIDARDGDDNILINDAAGVVTVGSGKGFDTLDVDADNDANEAAVTFFGSEDLQTLDIGLGSTVDLPLGSLNTLVIFGSVGGGWAGTLDLNDGFLVNRPGGTPIGTWVTGLTVGFAGGTWTGTGITSSVAAASARSDGLGYRLSDEPGLPPITSFGGALLIDPGTVCIGYTLNGDSDLDRDVDFGDLLRLAQNYNPAIGGRSWSQGNFNYNTADDVAGAVAFADLLPLAQNYGLPFLTTARAPAGRSRVFSQVMIEA